MQKYIGIIDRLARTALTLICCLGASASVASGNDACDDRDGLKIEFIDDFHKCAKGYSQRDPWEERIETERHDFTQSTKTVGRGVVQIESGYSYFYKDNEDEIEGSHTAPETLVRIGLSEDIEFRLRYSYGWTFVKEEEDQRGSQDLIWSFKLGMTNQLDWIPESALEVRFTAPTGGHAFSTERIEHGIDYIYGWEFNDRSKLYGSSGYVTGGLGDFGLLPENPADDWFVVFTQSVALETELIDRMTMYNEFFGLVSRELEDNFSIAFYNIGIDYYLSNDFVVDFRAGKGLTADSDDFFAGVGGGFRF